MSTHFSKGTSNSFAFVFSCPGRHEEEAGHPAAGITGANLDSLLQLIAQEPNYASLSRHHVTITNSWPKVEYETLTGRSESSDNEIRSVDNVLRLAKELQHVTQLIVFSGKKAAIASEELSRRQLLSRSPAIAYIVHLGLRGINSIRTDLCGAPILSATKQLKGGRTESLGRIRKENTRGRLQVIASHLLATLARAP